MEWQQLHMVCVGVLQQLLSQIRKNFDLTEEKINSKIAKYPKLENVANNILKSLSVKGIISLLGRQSGKVATQQMSKYIPFIGQAIAATAGFSITYLTGTAYLDDCYKIAEAMINDDLEYQNEGNE